MKVRSDKASRRSAQLARRAPVSPVAALPAATAFSRRPWRTACAVNGVAAAVAGILYGASGAAYAQAAQTTLTSGTVVRAITAGISAVNSPS